MMKLKNGISLLALSALAFSMSTASKAAVIAVVDSGTDIKHPELAGRIWDNPTDEDDAVDNDDNGYIDDIHGWNFPDNDNRLYNKKLVGTFPKDVYTFFALQTKMLNGQATADEIAWMKTKVQDVNFLTSLQNFGNFVHGTHVAGISARDADAARIMTLRLIGGASSSLRHFPSPVSAMEGSGLKEKLIYLGLDALAMAQGKGMAPVGAYIAQNKARVANCSFGASRHSIEPLLKPLIEKILGAPLTDEQLHKYADYFLNKTVAAMKQSLIDPAKGKTLFVIAAGNDGSDNDVAPTAPANVRAENTITVAATLGRSRLASFSNYGATMVDIAAPGVGIRSSIPGNEYLQLSGTSQAAPFVTNLAGRIMDTNELLSMGEVKRILMETVDKKDFLSGKVISSGIANPDRALHAAQLSLSLPLDEAISRANREVAPVKEILDLRKVDEADLYVTPLPSILF